MKYSDQIIASTSGPGVSCVGYTKQLYSGVRISLVGSDSVTLGLTLLDQDIKMRLGRKG